MHPKLFILCALAAVALAREYPAGVFPAVCPNYPFCDNALLARYYPDGQPKPEWVYNPSILPVAPADPNANIAVRYPANMNPAVCPNYPFCDNTVLIRYYPDGQPKPEWVYNPSILPVAPADPNANIAARYPANMNPAVCPNYPFCDTTVLARFYPDGQPKPEWVYNPSILPVAPADPNASVAPKSEPTLTESSTPTLTELSTPAAPSADEKISEENDD